MLRERHARWLRWLLIAGWLALLASLFIPASPWQGNRVFWGTVVPLSLLLIGGVSHELWRRLCPLAFVSQLAVVLGWQRRRVGSGGRSEPVMVQADSWLGRHHVQLQWSLLIAALCLRLLGGNSDPLWLGLWLLLTLAAALTVGWAFGGKAWCHYICPMGPVQTVLTGMRGPLGSTAHVAAPSRLTQSMCRTISAEGKERSACVSCQSTCFDIDAERAFWHTLSGKRGLAWAWYSYPGLVLGFFLVLELVGQGCQLPEHSLGYLRSGHWALDPGLAARIWQPLPPLGSLPRLLTVPLALTAAGWLSVVFWRGVERLLHRQATAAGHRLPREQAVARTRLLSSFAALNIFFWYSDPLQGVLGLNGGQLDRSLVLLLSALALFRGWRRDQAIFRRETTSERLRHQLRHLPGLEPALDGRRLEALPPAEVFTLVKALPAAGRHQARHVYAEAVAEMVATVRLDWAHALRELKELRQLLHLDDDDHQAVVEGLSRDHPELRLAPLVQGHGGADAPP